MPISHAISMSTKSLLYIVMFLQSILRTFFERKGLTKKATNCLNVRAQLHLQRFMAYDNCHRHSGADASGPSTPTEVFDCVVCYTSCPARARHRAQSQSLL